jgi:hypothetical protein
VDCLKCIVLNLRLIAIADLHPTAILKQLDHLMSRQASVCVHQPAEASQLIVSNICSSLLRK